VFKAQQGYHPEIGVFELRGEGADARPRTIRLRDLDALLEMLELVRRS
jgi:hypothetical protein